MGVEKIILFFLYILTFNEYHVECYFWGGTKRLAYNLASAMVPFFIRENLELRNYRIKSVSGAAMVPDLVKLDLQNNQIVNLRGISVLSDLEKLILNDNLIEDFGVVEQLENLVELELSRNRITNLPATLPSSLERLVLSENCISELKSVQNMTSLHFFDVSSNSIRTIPPSSGLTGVQYVDLSHNLLEDLDTLAADVQGNLSDKKQAEMHLEGNSFRLQEENCIALRILKDYFWVVKVNRDLEEFCLRLWGNSESQLGYYIDRLSESELEMIETKKVITINGTKIKSVGDLHSISEKVLHALHTVEVLEVTNSEMESMADIGLQLPALQKLNLAANSIPEIDCTHLKYLKSLVLDENDVSDFIQLLKCQNLEELSLKNNSLSSLYNLTRLLHFSHLQKLKRVDVRGNADIDIRNNCTERRMLQHIIQQFPDLTIEIDGIENLGRWETVYPRCHNPFIKLFRVTRVIRKVGHVVKRSLSSLGERIVKFGKRILADKIQFRRLGRLGRLGRRRRAV